MGSVRAARQAGGDGDHQCHNRKTPQQPNPFSLSDEGMNPRDALPYLAGASYLGVLPKVKAEAEAREANRTRSPRVPLSRRTKVQQTATA